ncbi:hypothetical protein [Mucilaginibacter sp.]|uniref:hypothetical protein n=1 Tax=Mucilaginibacter sp. TaxID=1882438 RepID=UPI0025F7B970|nr:hypothetical protein [Mucilaginibacter sp.]
MAENTTSNTKLEVSKVTLPGVYIIESLDIDDENGPREGKIIADILEMSGIENQYFYVRTKDELVYFIDKFVESEFRFLHLSCHGNEHGIATTLDNISNEELKNILKGKLKFRRLFLSACAAVNPNLACSLFPSSQCNSIVGPSQAVFMDEIAIFWASFYHLMFKNNPSAMKKIDLISTLDSLAKLYVIPIKYFKKKLGTPFYSEQKLMSGASKPSLSDYD